MAMEGSRDGDGDGSRADNHVTITLFMAGRANVPNTVRLTSCGWPLINRTISFYSLPSTCSKSP